MSKSNICINNWVERDLSQEDIVAYLREEARMEDEWTDEEVSHVADIIHNIYKCMMYKRQGGHFVENFMANDLVGCISRADNTIRRGLPYIVRYFYNAAPMYVWEAITSSKNAREMVMGRQNNK